MTAEAINGAAHIARTQAADGKSGHGEGRRPAMVNSDQRHRQHRRVKQRAPRQDFGKAEHAHRTPGTEDERAGAWHDRPSCRENRQKETRRNPTGVRNRSNTTDGMNRRLTAAWQSAMANSG